MQDGFGWTERPGQSQGLSRPAFSNLNEDTNHLEIVVKYRFRFSRSEAEPGSPLSSKLPAEAKAAHLRRLHSLSTVRVR